MHDWLKIVAPAAGAAIALPGAMARNIPAPPLSMPRPPSAVPHVRTVRRSTEIDRWLSLCGMAALPDFRA
jgi:hypothetical protein